MSETAWVIFYTPNLTYYSGWTGIGPCYGATEDGAARFALKEDALAEMRRHWSFGDASVVEVEVVPDEEPAP